MSARRLFPYLATLLVVLFLAGVFVLRPTPFIGVTADAMAGSLDDEIGTATTTNCEEAGEDAWSCVTAGDSAGRPRTYDVTVNGFGCWTAEPSGDVPEVGTPPTLTGCITLFDH